MIGNSPLKDNLSISVLTSGTAITFGLLEHSMSIENFGKTEKYNCRMENKEKEKREKSQNYVHGMFQKTDLLGLSV